MDLIAVFCPGTGYASVSAAWGDCWFSAASFVEKLTIDPLFIRSLH